MIDIQGVLTSKQPTCRTESRIGGDNNMRSYFRHPKTQNERTADAATDDELHPRAKARRRGKKKGGLPSDRDDLRPAAIKDRSRGKPTQSSKRKAKAKLRN